MTNLEAKSVASNANNSSLNILAAEQLVLVRNAGKVALRSGVLAGAEVVVALDSVAVLLGELGGQGILDVDEDVALDQGLGAHASVDAGVAALVVGVVDVGGAEADQGLARVDVLPVVVRVGDVEEALVVGAGVGVADERCLVVVVEESVAGKGDVSYLLDFQKRVNVLT